MADETTTDTLAEIEQQAAGYTPPEGWRVLQVGETITPGDVWIRPDDKQAFDASRIGHQVHGRMCYIRRIPEPQPHPEPQPVQVREGRWRTRGGKEISVTAMPTDHTMYLPGYPWWDGDVETWKNDGGYYKNGEADEDLVEYLGPIEAEPERTITPDDVAAETINEWPSMQTLRRQLETTEAALLEQQQRNEQLVTQGSQQRMQIAELRSEVSHVQRLLGEEKRRIVELETLVKDLRAVNAATEKAVNSAARDKADLQHRLDTVAAEWALQAGQISGLQAQLEAVKAELVQERLERNHWQNHAQRTETQLVEKVSECRNLRIELDALQQAPQAETVAAVPKSTEDRFEEGWDAGTARAVETIAEWLEPIRTLIDAADNVEETSRANSLAADIMQNLPHIMRTLTGLADED